MLDTAYRVAGYRVGTYTSPHLVHYNERIKLAGEPVADDVICRAFTQVEAARGEIPLTFLNSARWRQWSFLPQQPRKSLFSKWAWVGG